MRTFISTRILGSLLALIAAATLAAPASASSPALLAVGHDKLHPTASFAAAGANDVTVYISSSPDRGTDGSFLAENSAGVDFLTADEIASGTWMDSGNLDPGTYYVMLRASTYSCPDGTDCVDGYSAMLELTIPKPKQRYKATKKSGYLASLTLTVTPAGEAVPYKLCWRRGKSQKCKRGTVTGFDWTRSASDTIYLTVDDLKLPKAQTKTTFTWYVAGKRVASKPASIGPV